MSIFDKLMKLPGLNILEPFYKRHKEVLLYLFFGGTAFFMNLFLFIAIDKIFGIDALINNAVCWVICVIFQYFTNKIWVFENKTKNFIELLRQIISFFSGRIFTLLVEEIIIAIFITWLKFDTLSVKLSAQIIVIILNYVISKMIIFKKRQG